MNGSGVMVNSTPPARRAQRPNTTKATRKKAREHTVQLITPHVAFVDGVHDTYQVTFSDLRCSCDAGRVGLKCSHVLAALAERAALRGRPHIMFAHSGKHAGAWARAMTTKGRQAEAYQHAGYFWVESSSKEDMPRKRKATPLDMAALTAAVDELF